jgi:hypothetical protein
MFFRDFIIRQKHMIFIRWRVIRHTPSTAIFMSPFHLMQELTKLRSEASQLGTPLRVQRQTQIKHSTRAFTVTRLCRAFYQLCMNKIHEIRSLFR